MSQPPILTGQDIAEAEGAVSRLLEHTLAPTGTSRQQYVVLRVLVVRGPFDSPRELHEYLAGQPQLGLGPEAVAALLGDMQKQGLATGTSLDSPGPAQATGEGTALLTRLAETVAPTTRQLFAGLDPDDLAAAHRVLTQIVARAGELTARP
jgi:hypothetical protein